MTDKVATKHGDSRKPKGVHKPTSGRIARPTVPLADGTTAVLKSAPAARERETDKDVPGTYSLITALLGVPQVFQLFDHVPRDPSQFGGRRRTWPPELHSVLFVLQFVYPELRRSIRELTDDPNRLRLLTDAVCNNINDPVALARFRNALKTEGFPSRPTVARFWKTHVDLQLMGERLRQTGVDLALARGHFRADSITNPQWNDMVYSDGTVLKPPSDESYETAVDPKTGEFWHPKVDVGSRTHKQNSASEPIVNGTKATALLTRHKGYLNDIFLGLCITEEADPASEADDALDLLELVREDLRSKQPDANILTMAHDGAATGKHHERLVASGTLLVNFPSAKRVHTDPETGKKIRDQEHRGDMGVWSHRDRDCPGHNLCGIGGDIHLQEIVNGKFEYRKLIHQPSRKTAKGKSFYYELIDVPCPTNPTANESKQTRTIRVPWHQARHETAAAYHARVRYSRPWGMSSETGTRLRGIRQSVEGRFSMLDRDFPFSRIPAYSKETKLRLLFGYMIGYNIAMAGLEQRAGP